MAPILPTTVFQVAPLGDGISDESFLFSPEVDTHEYRDIYGNRCLRVVMPTGASHFRYRAFVDVPDATEDFDVNAPQIAPHDLASALGADQINGLMSQSGLSRDELLSGLSQHLPEVINHLTPDGRLPTESELSGRL